MGKTYNRESVTFAAGRLDRSAVARAEASSSWDLEHALVLPMWRLKPLVREDGRLALIPSKAPILSNLPSEPLFLGLAENNGAPVFAADLSHLDPVEDAVDAGPFDPVSTAVRGVKEGQFVDLRGAMGGLDGWEAELAATARGLLAWHRTHGFCAACGEPSVIAMGGWERRCGACSAVHYPRTDPVVIMLVTYGNSVLLGRNKEWPENMYSLLAGFVEPGEPIEAAVRREVLEESAIRIGRVDYIASQPWPFPTSLMIGCRAEALSHEITIDPAELEAALWVPRERVASAMAGLDPSLKPARKGAIAHFLLTRWLEDRLD
ncbi:NAD(+) diphosphatase [Celeribacter arenosi]|uniref:NAD(+) diphosphatase n=1 Tax=Celeribacter arenosi TaxID=792649 RepID=A0ABP7K1A6_9RHOB